MNRIFSGFASPVPFFLSSFVWNFALGMTYILIPLQASVLGMSGVQIGALVSLPVIAQIVFNLLGGAFSDRIGGKNMAMSACIMTALAGLVFMSSTGFAGMFAAQLMMVMSRAMFWPATWSLASQLPGSAGTQMGRLNSATNAGQIFGTAAAGFIIVQAGFRFGFGTMAAAGLVALALNQMFRQPASLSQGKHQPILATYRMLIRRRAIRFGILCAYISALPISLSFSFYPILLVEQGFNSDAVGSLISLRAVGAIAAGFFAGHLVKNVRGLRVPLLSAVTVGLSVALAAIVSQPALIALFLLGLGAGSAMMTIYFQMLISSLSSSATRGSAMALGGLGWGISHLTTPILMGFLKDSLGIQSAFVIMGGLALACGLALAPLQRWAFRQPGETGGR